MFERLLADLRGRRDHYQSRARRRFYLIRTQSEDKIFDLRASTLSTVGEWLTKAEQRVTDELTKVIDTGIEGYDELTAKAVAAEVKGLDSRAQLVRIQRYEAANKDRKTVLSAIEDRLESLVPDLVALPEPEAIEETVALEVLSADETSAAA